MDKNKGSQQQGKDDDKNVSRQNQQRTPNLEKGKGNDQAANQGRSPSVPDKNKGNRNGK